MPTEQSGKKSKNKKSGKNKTYVVLDGISTADMTKEQLEDHVKRLKEELEKEREERNYYQLEKDQVSAYYEISKTQLEQKNAVIRNKERQLEEAIEKHQTELKVYKQKVKHLMYEHQNNLTEARADKMLAVRIAEEEHANEMKNDWHLRQALISDANQQQQDHGASIKQLKLSYDEQMTSLRKEFEESSMEAVQRNEAKVKELREEMDLVRRTEIASLEEKKNKQIGNLMQSHEKAFNDIKNYYNDITISNLALINSLKEKTKELEAKDEKMERRMRELEEEKKTLKEPLDKLTSESKEMHKKLSMYVKEHASLQTTKSRLKRTERDLKEMAWELEVTRQKFSQVEKERDELYSRFVTAIGEVQQKSGLKNVLLEKKLASIHADLEKKEDQFKRVMSADSQKRIDDIIDLKNSTIDNLKQEIARLCKGHNDMVRAYEARLSDYGISKEDLGFNTYMADSAALDQKLSKGPAGLVSAF